MAKVVLDSHQIRELLPHRYPILLVDRVLELSDTQIVAEKIVSANEPVLQGHFPGRPIYPGVYILESLAQTAAIFGIKAHPEFAGQGMALVGIEKARFRHPVLPGSTLQLHGTLVRQRGPLLRFQAVARVEGETVAEAKLLAMFVDWDQ